ncbi:hypothetical protein Hanom_Chr16g01430101 [Helianthus anomalus]
MHCIRRLPCCHCLLITHSLELRFIFRGLSYILSRIFISILHTRSQVHIETVMP